MSKKRTQDRRPIRSSKELAEIRERAKNRMLNKFDETAFNSRRGVFKLRQHADNMCAMGLITPSERIELEARFEKAFSLIDEINNFCGKRMKDVF